MKSLKLKAITFYIIYPFSWLWEVIYRLRRFFYSIGVFNQNEFAVPVISVGNLTFGGTGKTPFTLWMARYLENQDKKVVILTRGYKGKLENKGGVLKSGKRLGFNASLFGDEPLIFTRRLKNTSIIVGKKRSENLEYYFDETLPDVVLLDDGHQHLKISRSLNLVLFDSTMDIERYKVAPLGYMREGFGALKDADLVILGRCDYVSEDKREQLKELILSHGPHLKFAEVFYVPHSFLDMNYEKAFELEDIKNRPVIAIAGVASPQSFFQSIEALGGDLVETKSFNDHHDFSEDEIDQVLALAKEKDAIIVTTEKDIVKIRRLCDSERIVFLEIKLKFLSGEEQTKKLIDQVF